MSLRRKKMLQRTLGTKVRPLSRESATDQPTPPEGQPHFVEFILLMSMLFSLIAFSTDAMLPALPRIAAELVPDDVNRAQLVVSVFIMGTGLGQLVAGPISDSFGRKPIIVAGTALYLAGCIAAILSPTLEWLLAARLVQGLGVSAPRTVALALVRDIYVGRRMARVMSLSMMFFVLVPAVSPWIGQHVMALTGWRGIFAAFMVFAAVAVGWLVLRQPETLPVPRRRAITAASYRAATGDVFSSRVVVTYALVLSLGFAVIFTYLVNAQQVFADVFGLRAEFPRYFAVIALLSGFAGFANASLVMRFGMRPIVTIVYGALALVSASLATAVFGGLLAAPETLLPVFMVWSVAVFLSAGLCIGNLNALALEPMGHIAGFASAIVGASATVLSALYAIPVGLAFDGSVLPLVSGIAGFSGLAWLLMLTNPKAQASTLERA